MSGHHGVVDLVGYFGASDGRRFLDAAAMVGDLDPPDPGWSPPAPRNLPPVVAESYVSPREKEAVRAAVRATDKRGRREEARRARTMAKLRARQVSAPRQPGRHDHGTQARRGEVSDRLIVSVTRKDALLIREASDIALVTVAKFVRGLVADAVPGVSREEPEVEDVKDRLDAVGRQLKALRGAMGGDVRATPERGDGDG